MPSINDLSSLLGLNTYNPGSATGTPFGYSSAYGGIPNLPGTSTDTSTQVHQDPWLQLSGIAPGLYPALQADVGNISNNLAGKISPTDLVTAMQSGAQHGVGIGSPGSPASNAAYLRALGLTQLQMEQLGHNQLTQLMTSIPLQMATAGSQTTDLGPVRSAYAAAPNPSAAAAARNSALLAGIRAAGTNQSYSPATNLYTHPISPSGNQYGVPSQVTGGGSTMEDPWVWDPQAGAYYNQWTGDYDFTLGAGTGPSDAELTAPWNTGGTFGGSEVSGDYGGDYEDWSWLTGE